MPINNPNMNRLFQNAGQNQAQQGTGYTNLNRLMEANKNNALGQKVSGDISSQLSGIKGQLGQQQEQFNKEADANKLDTEQNKSQREAVLGRFTSPSAAGGELQDKDVEQFNKFRGGEYAGPSGLKDTGAISTAASGLAQQTSNFSPSGTQELLRRSVGGGRYSQGQQRLDTLLMDRSALAPIQRQAQGLNQDINRANLAAQGKAQLYKNQAQQFGQETQNQLQQGLTGIDTAVQGQLASAQEAEKQRQAKIQAIQGFAQNKVAVLDESGNPKTDQYGNTIYDQSAARGGKTSQETQLDYLQNLLKGQGASGDELTQLFGQGNAEAADLARQQELRNISDKAARNTAAGLLGGSGGVTTLNPELQNQYMTQIQQPEGGFTSSIDKNRLINDIVSGKISMQNINEIGLSNLDESGVSASGNAYSGSLGRAIENEIHNNPYVARQYSPLRDAANEKFYSGLGTAGQAIKGGNLESFYQNLARSTANTPSAQNLTAQGVSSDSQRQNYEALNKLLGKSSEESKYRTGADKYEAGKFLLNPDLIKKSTV